MVHLLLQLSRVSNLPTVWTNTLAGAVLSGSFVADTRLLFLLVATSLFYCGGMLLNDAFDAAYDTEHQPYRPIPSGQISRQLVFLIGFGMLLLGLVLLSLNVMLNQSPFQSVVAGLLLCVAIVLYDMHHKQNRFGPVIMGLCRALVYIAAACAYGWPVNSLVILAAASLFLYIVGLTYTAKQEARNPSSVSLLHHWPVATLWLALLIWPLSVGNAITLFPFAIAALVALILVTAFALLRFKRRQPGDIPSAVTTLIAGISLLDAVWIAGAMSGSSNWQMPLLAALGFVLTLYLQRFYRGT